jgi:hypothetical protein
VKEIARGGNGIVWEVVDRKSGMRFACKSIPKDLGPSASSVKREGHAQAIRTEVEVLRRFVQNLRTLARAAVWGSCTAQSDLLSMLANSQVSIM